MYYCAAAYLRASRLDGSDMECLFIGKIQVSYNGSSQQLFFRIFHQHRPAHHDPISTSNAIRFTGPHSTPISAQCE